MSDLGFAVIGPGRVGRCLVDRLTSCGWRCVALRGRGARPAPPTHPSVETAVDSWEQPLSWEVPPLLMVAVADRDLAAVADRMAVALDLEGRVVLHTSGLHPAEVLAPCRAAGARVASWHPLLSFASVPLPHEAWTGAPCAIEGDVEAVELGDRLARAIGLLPWRIPAEQKTRYHAAAAVAANLSHVCVAAARELLSDLGIPERGESPLAPLVRASTDAALAGKGLENLTGALARGDRETVARHLASLPEDLASAYAALARWVDSRRGAGPH